MSDVAIRLEGVGKMYKIFPSRAANFADALGFPGRRHKYREFWALRGIDFELAPGRRLGIVGRNGAGKSTLLKLLTGNVAQTEGMLVVNGAVQALIEAGSGFHPEFTGEENIRAALTLQGAPPGSMREMIEEIAEFTELGEFLGQPFRTYSAGMQARLAFATATAILPEILIVDEMLSAGDAYFSSKANERMRGLVDGGATLLLVSHSLDHITMFCDEAIWIDRGQIVRRGSSLEVVKAYQQFTRVLDERRLKAKNRKLHERTVATHQLDHYAERLVVRLVSTDTGADEPVEVDAVRLVRDGEVEESVAVGDAQDGNTVHPAHVVLDEGGWSAPVKTQRGLARRLERQVPAAVAFDLYAIFEESHYAVEVDVRGSGLLRLELSRGASARGRWEGPVAPDWSTIRVEMTSGRPQVEAVGARVTAADYDLPTTSVVAIDGPGGAPETARAAGSVAAPVAKAEVAPESDLSVRHWPGEGSLRIGAISLSGPLGEQAVFDVGSPLTVSIPFTARDAGVFPVTPVLIVYRLDGIRVSAHVGPSFEASLDPGEGLVVRFDLNRINLGDGRYVLSIALYRRLEHLGSSEAYDLIDRSYEFEVVGNDPLKNALFHHPATWSLP